MAYQPISWRTYFLSLAVVVSTKSKDPNGTQVGCVIVGTDNEIRTTGFNGIPRNVRDLPERMERPAKYLWTSHAEENAVAQAALIGSPLKGCTAYITHPPCARCARMLIQAGIKSIVVGSGKLLNMPAEDFSVAREMLKEANIELTETRPL